MASSDDDWRKESDANTLVEAKLIRADRKRFKAAVSYIRAKNKAEESVIKDDK